ncbi:MAG: flippase-like domain-containing protein [Flavobacteriales bacterium]|nr:flippase-like domain-containing protein [Flavobacteriales bacterium]
MKKKVISVLKILLFISLGLAVIVWFWHNMAENDKQKFWTSIEQANYFWLVFSILLGALSHFSRALRWRLIIYPFGYTPRVPNLFFAVMNMYFANMAVPRLGEITRCAILQQYEKIPFEKTFGTVVAERVMDLLMLLLFFGFTFLLMADYIDPILQNFHNLRSAEGLDVSKQEPSFLTKNLKWIILGLGAAIFGLLFLLRNHPYFGKFFLKIQGLLRGFWEGLKSIIRVKNPIEFSFHTLFIWAMYFFMTYVCFYSLPATSNLSWLAGLTVLVFGSLAITIVPGGIGVFPVIVAAVLNIPVFGNIDPGTGLALGWIIWASQTLLILILGIISFVLLPVYNRS